MARTSEFQTIRSEGGLLPSDLLRRVLDPRAKLEGTSPESYGLPQGERLNEVITQSWNRLCRHWTEFRNTAENLPAGEAATGPTNDKWTLPLLRELGFGTLPTSAAPEIEGRSYPISRFHGPVPLHLVGCGLNLDRRTAGARGAASSNPHGMVQEFLNRSQGHLWAIVSNGRQLRVLRDNQALSRQSFIEFDIEAMFSGQVYPDFVLMWMVAHVSRFLPREGDKADSCLLERWTKIADEEGTRALGELRGSVAKALQVLGAGFTANPRNTALHTALSTNQLTPAELHAELLRIVYRLIFLFVAEDRQIEGQPLLHPRDKSDAARIARERYAEHYGTARLRELAGSIKGSRHGDLWRQFKMLAKLLSDDPKLDAARGALALPVLGGFLWNESATPHLNDAELMNHDFMEVLRHLAYTRHGKALRSVDFRNLGAEELGGVYETLLELTPQVSGGGRKFEFAEFAGNKRKTSGSYYTPDSLVQCLLDTALDPVVNEAIAGKTPREAEAAVLNLKICDPAVGSGHFLVGAAHRMARHLARVRSLAEGEGEPSPLHYQHALRDVIGRCLYGVDINPMSAELCRVGLWLEAMEPGKPLSFLDHHIRIGNSLLGVTPELITAGLPDEAFTAIEGDEKAACIELKKLNKGSRKKEGTLFAVPESERINKLARAAANVAEMPDDRPEDIRAKERAHRLNEETAEFRRAKLIADAWCAAFVCEKSMSPAPSGSLGRGNANGIVQGHILDLANGRGLNSEIQTVVERLAVQYKFFHWHLVFPEVFDCGGFDCVLGNPPWERVKLSEKEWFAERSPAIASASNAGVRKRLIEKLKVSDFALYQRFLDDSRKAEGESHFIRNCGRYLQCGKGDVNTYAVFAELNRILIGPSGRAGFIVQSDIATGDTYKEFFADLLAHGLLVSLYDFVNTEGIFPGVHRTHPHFCLITLSKGHSPAVADFAFWCTNVGHLSDRSRHFTLREDELVLLNPNTCTCPIFRSDNDAVLTKAIYRRVPVFVRDAQGGKLEENDWGLRIRRVFDMNRPEVIDLCVEQEPLECDMSGWLPMLEAKLIHQFDHQFASYLAGKTEELPHREKARGDTRVLPRFWVPAEEVGDRLGPLWDKRWLLAWRDITNTTNERTAIAAVLPFSGTDFTLRVGFPAYEPARTRASLLANLNSFVFDYCVRQQMGGAHLSDYIMKQLPVLPPTRYEQKCQWDQSSLSLEKWLLPRVLELSYTTSDLEAFAGDCDWSGPPFRWDENRRFLIRCELDAAFFHLYLQSDTEGDWRQVEGEASEDLMRLATIFPTPRDAAAYIMDTFPIVRRKDEARCDGDYHTKRVILENFVAFADAVRTGKPFQTRLDPPPADPRCCHSTQRDHGKTHER